MQAPNLSEFLSQWSVIQQKAPTKLMKKQSRGREKIIFPKNHGKLYKKLHFKEFAQRYLWL